MNTVKESTLLELEKQNRILVALCKALCEQYPNARYGLAHVVVDDFNFDDRFLDACIAGLERTLTVDVGDRREFEATLYTLRAIQAFPRSVRCLPMAYAIDADDNVIVDGVLYDDEDMTY